MGGEASGSGCFVAPVSHPLTAAVKEWCYRSLPRYARSPPIGPLSMPVVRPPHRRARAENDPLRQLIIRAVAALGRRQAAALCGDGSALHAVRRGDLELHLVLAVRLAVLGRGLELVVRHLVNLSRAHVLPHERDLERHLVLDADV